MRCHTTAIALGLASAAGVLIAEGIPAPAQGAQRLPRLIAGSYSGIKPREVDFSGDAGNIVVKIRWSRWTQTTAVGHGTSDIQGCVPNCAQGTETPVATSVTFSRPRDGHFTKVVERRAGRRYVAYDASLGWPEGARA
jgi:hypothetical protein